MSRLADAWRYLGRHGLIEMVTHGLLRMSELVGDRRLGIETCQPIHLDTLGIHNTDSVQYSPVPYSSLKLALRGVPATPGGDTFVDFGAGKGRVVILAATLPFRRVIGIELAPFLATQARENIELARHRHTCANIEILQMDAIEYDLPPDATVLHFYNPFRGDTLKKVVANVASSLRTAPRRMTILFANPDNFERIMDEEHVIPPHWIKKRTGIPWPYFKQDASFGNMYIVYWLDSRDKQLGKVQANTIHGRSN